MLTVDDKVILESVVERCPRFIKYLEQKLQAELNDLPSTSSDRVQVIQGRCLMLQALLAELKAVGK